MTEFNSYGILCNQKDLLIYGIFKGLKHKHWLLKFVSQQEFFILVQRQNNLVSKIDKQKGSVILVRFT